MAELSPPWNRYAFHTDRKEQPTMKEFHFYVTVVTDTAEHADQVMGERLGPDEDYGFEYRIPSVLRISAEEE